MLELVGERDCKAWASGSQTAWMGLLFTKMEKEQVGGKQCDFSVRHVGGGRSLCAIWIISVGQLDGDPELNREVLGGDCYVFGARKHMDGS